MPRQSWTDDRMDDLVERIDLRFDHVDERFDRVVDERLKAEVRQETKELRQEIRDQGAELCRRFDALQRTLRCGFLVLIATLIGLYIATLATQLS